LVRLRLHARRKSCRPLDRVARRLPRGSLSPRYQFQMFFDIGNERNFAFRQSFDARPPGNSEHTTVRAKCVRPAKYLRNQKTPHKKKNVAGRSLSNRLHREVDRSPAHLPSRPVAGTIVVSAAITTCGCPGTVDISATLIDPRHRRLGTGATFRQRPSSRAKIVCNP